MQDKLENNYSVYQHITPDNMHYFGQSQNVEKRWECNGIHYKETALYPYIEKYGWDNIQHIILFENQSKENALWIEDFLITTAQEDGVCINKNRSGLISKEEGYKQRQQKQYREQNKDKILEYQQQYREQNKDKILEYQQQYREQNKEQIREQKQQYYEQNKDKKLEYQQEYYEQNKQQMREQQKQYYEQNKQQILEQQKQYYEQNKQQIRKQRRQRYQKNRDKINEQRRQRYQRKKEEKQFKEFGNLPLW